MRVDTQTILTIHNNVITRNPRISLKRPESNVWTLQLQRVQPDDRGWYMCQINTDPMRHRSGYFEVVGKSLIQCHSVVDLSFCGQFFIKIETFCLKIFDSFCPCFNPNFHNVLEMLKSLEKLTYFVQNL